MFHLIEVARFKIGEMALTVQAKWFSLVALDITGH
jgi:hypothetical protein